MLKGKEFVNNTPRSPRWCTLFTKGKKLKQTRKMFFLLPSGLASESWVRSPQVKKVALASQSQAAGGVTWAGFQPKGDRTKAQPLRSGVGIDLGSPLLAHCFMLTNKKDVQKEFLGMLKCLLCPWIVNTGRFNLYSSLYQKYTIITHFSINCMLSFNAVESSSYLLLYSRFSSGKSMTFPS